MVRFHPKFLTDASHRLEAVLLPIKEWEKLMEELEELEDLRAYDTAKASREDRLNFDQAVAGCEVELGGQAGF